MWIARDNYDKYAFKGVKEFSNLHLFLHKPVLLEEQGVQYWAVDEDKTESYFECIQLNYKNLPEVTFENSPIEVELKLKTK